MKNLGQSRVVRALYMSVAAMMVGAMMSIGIVSPSSAAPITPSTATLVAELAAPAAMGVTPVSSHCGANAQWVTYLKGQDSRLKFRVWFYTDSDKTRQYCVKIYKVKPKKNKTVIGLDAYSIYGDVPSKRTKGSSVYIRVPAPKGWTSYAQARYGKVIYTWMSLYND